MEALKNAKYTPIFSSWFSFLNSSFYHPVYMLHRTSSGKRILYVPSNFARSLFNLVKHGLQPLPTKINVLTCHVLEHQCINLVCVTQGDILSFEN